MKYWLFLPLFTFIVTVTTAQRIVPSTWSFTTAPEATIDVADVSSDGRRVGFLTKSEDQKLGIIDMATGNNLAFGSIPTGTTPIFLGVLPDGVISLVHTRDTYAIALLRDGDTTVRIHKIWNTVLGSMLSPDKSRLYLMIRDDSGNGDTFLRCYRADDAEHISDYPIAAWIRTHAWMSMAPDGKHYVAYYHDPLLKGYLGYFDLATGVPLPLTVPEKLGYVHNIKSLAFDLKKGTLITGAYDYQPQKEGHRASIVEWSIEDTLRPISWFPDLRDPSTDTSSVSPPINDITTIGVMANGEYLYALTSRNDAFFIRRSGGSVRGLPRTSKYLAAHGDSVDAAMLATTLRRVSALTLEPSPTELFTIDIFGSKPGAPTQSLLGCGYRADGNLVTISSSAMMHVWDARTGAIREAIPLPVIPDNGFATTTYEQHWLHHRGNDWAITTSRDSIFMISLLDGSVKWSTVRDARVYYPHMAVSRDGTVFAAYSGENVHAWNVRSNTRSSLTIGSRFAVAFSLSRDGSELRVVYDGYLIRIHVGTDGMTPVDTTSLVRSLGITPPIASAHWSDDDRSVIITSVRDTLYVADYPAITLRTHLSDPCDLPVSLLTTNAHVVWLDGGRYAVSLHEDRLSVIDLRATSGHLRLSKTTTWDDRLLNLWSHVAVAPDGSAVAALDRILAGNQQSLHVWCDQPLVSVQNDVIRTSPGLVVHVDPAAAAISVTIPEAGIGGVIYVVDINGTIVASCPAVAMQCAIPVASLASGIYSIVLDGPSGRLATHCVLAR